MSVRNFGLGDGEGSSGLDNINFVDDGDYVCTLQTISHVVMEDQMRQIKGKSIDATRFARMGILNSMNEEDERELRKLKVIQYQKESAP